MVTLSWLLIVATHPTDMGRRSFAVAGPSSWNVLLDGSRSSSSGLDTFQNTVKHICLGRPTLDRTQTFEFVL